jgi:hypothetical protein
MRPAMALLALALSAYASFAVASLGDYPADGGPALAALLHGNLHAFARARAEMGALSLLMRAPFAALAYLGSPTEAHVYRWGVLPCVASVAVLGLWLAELARRRGTGAPGQWIIVILSLVNPLVYSAITMGHPEELMTASLCVGALVAALERRELLCVVLLGLALACKQWTVVAVLPILFALERGRLRALFGSLLLAAAVTLPEVLGGPASYLHNQLALSHEQELSPSSFSWWWPITPDVTRHLLVEGHAVAFTGHRLSRALGNVMHTLTIAIDGVVALLGARLARLPLRRDQAFALMAIVLLLRCATDTETMPYYHAALFLDLLAWDALSGARMPLRALAAAAVSYLLFERLVPGAIATSLSSLLYGATALVVLALLARVLFMHRSAPPRPVEAGRSLSARLA